MAPMKSSDQNPKSGGAEDGGVDDVPSHILWVGNLFSDTTDADLMGLFGDYGALDCITNYSSRSFAFVYFKDPGEAKGAKDALQGHVLLGSPIKIEFSRPSRPGKNVWVGAIGSKVTKEQLEDEFKKFGKFEDLRFFRDRNTAIVNYYKLDDAIAAVKNMNGKQLDGEAIRVDYLRSQPSRRDNWSDYRDSRDGQVKRGPGSDSAWRQSSSQSMGGRREGQPSNTLWIGYPPSVEIDQGRLHNAMILFGEIERIKTFQSRHYAFVEFRSVDEARRAKEGLQGRLFNDPRIHIMFSSSDYAPGKDNSSFYPGMRGSGTDMHFNEPPFGPNSMEMLGHPRQMGLNNFPVPSPPSGMHGSYMRPFGPRGFEPSPDSYNDFNGPMGSNWRRLSSPTSGILPAPGMRSSIRPTWDAYDANSFQREPKRSRLEGSLPDGNVQIHIHDSPLVGRGRSLDRPTYGDHQSLPANEFIWRGVIAKGGSPVCHARCVPIGKGLDSQLPEIVNCSAKTGLDMLAKHYAEATGFDIVYFLPDSEEDFASYTEFLRYLGARNRAGVAKFDDGTTFFLVPPSDFLTQVLNVSGPERLYGVVLKLPLTQTQQRLVSPAVNSEYVERPPVSAQTDFNLSAHKEDHGLQMNYGRVMHDDSTPHIGSSKPMLASVEESRLMQPGSTEYGSGAPAGQSQTGMALTPELIATLAALIPSNAQSPATSAQLPLGSSVRPPLPSYPFTAGPEKVIQPHGWRQDEQSSLLSQQLALQYNNQTPLLPQMPAFAAEHSTQTVFSAGPQVHETALQMQQTGPIPSTPMNNIVGAIQGAQLGIPQSAQQYQFDGFRPPISQPPMPTATSVAQQSGGTQQYGVYDNPSVEFSNHVQQLQSSVSTSGQGQADGEVDKNQRYQSTLQFAASLLLQIQQQQQQQQGSAQATQGSNNQQ